MSSCPATSTSTRSAALDLRGHQGSRRHPAPVQHDGRATTASPWGTPACSTPCPRRDIIADSVEYHGATPTSADALVCIPNCDKVAAGHADGRPAARTSRPSSFPAGPMEAGPRRSPTAPSRALDLIDVMYRLRRRQRLTTSGLLAYEQDRHARPAVPAPACSPPTR